MLEPVRSIYKLHTGHWSELLAEVGSKYTTMYMSHSFFSNGYEGIYWHNTARWHDYHKNKYSIKVIIRLTSLVNIQSDGQEGYKQASAFFHTS